MSLLSHILFLYLSVIRIHHLHQKHNKHSHQRLDTLDILHNKIFINIWKY